MRDSPCINDAEKPQTASCRIIDMRSRFLITKISANSNLKSTRLQIYTKKLEISSHALHGVPIPSKYDYVTCTFVS